ncbi:hypothetical protein LINGRAHAP2_LOCUS36742 [Linum grandiflorum]
MKMHWAILRHSSWFYPTKVSMIRIACYLLHNYVRTRGGPDIFEQAYVPPKINPDAQNHHNEPPIIGVEPSNEWTAFRNNLAATMWANRHGHV